MQFELNSVIKFVLLGMLLPGVQSEDAKTNSLECAKDFSDSTDYFPEKISIEDATLFQVEYKKYYKIVKNSSTKESIVLYQCGTKQPKVDSVTKYFEIPVSKVAVKDTSAISYLSALGVEDTIKAVDSTSSISNACIQKNLKDKTITALSTTNTTLAKEQLSRNKITFTSFDDPKNPDPLSVIISATMDPSLKARAEWLEYYSLFYNLEGKAQKITGAINDNYNCLKKKADSLKEKNSIKVAWVSYVEYNEDKYFTLSGAPFKKNLISDAGAELITSKEEKVKDAASLLELIKDADVIVDESFTIDSFDDFLKAFNLSKGSNNNDKATSSSAFVLKVFSAAGIIALVIPFLF
ncbi:hypothetical protein K502DRAFT_228157 [Neoconidiobolus thromboides FSU 785]|nr:hypothetical protein K502DRAFT_228157 [Neoconidiobolus thromboides FSU 785]